MACQRMCSHTSVSCLSQAVVTDGHFPTGEGSFGRVMQARAESIVAGMPERNIVAVKTTKGRDTAS